MYNFKTNFKQVILDYKNRKNIVEIYNELYDAIISNGIDSFSSFEDYSNACYLAVQICLSNDDYLNSNNIIQCYKNDTKIRNRKKEEWYYVYSIKIYGKRTPVYFLVNPEKLEKKLSYITVVENGDDILCELCNYYYHELFLGKNIKPELIIEFIKRFQSKGYRKFDEFSNSILSLMSDDYDEDDYIPVIEINNNKLLELEFNVEDEKLSIQEIEQINKAIGALVEEDKKSNDFSIITNNPKICIIGGTSMSIDDIRKVTRSRKFPDKNVDICIDYDKIQKYDLAHYKYNFDYIGIIVGPNGHSNVNNGSYSSICAMLKSEEGYPMAVECRTNSTPSELKITKKTLEAALDKILLSYNANKLKNKSF